MPESKQQSKLPRLVARLRDLEAACIRLSTTTLSSEYLAILGEYEERLQRLETSHSRSWFGDHSWTHYEGFVSPPAGRSFDVEWGFVPGYNGSHNPGWRIYSGNDVRQFVFRDIGDSIFYEVQKLANEISEQFSIIRDQALDVMDALAGTLKIEAIARYRERLDSKLKPYKITDYINSRAKSTPNMTRDSEEIAKGQAVPTHVQYLGPIESAKTNKLRLQETAIVIRNLIEAVSLHEPANNTSSPREVFIGHGRSEQWRILKDFVVERLGLNYEEFNRVSSAGINTQERLGEMLGSCGFAFMVLTAEDLHGDGSVHARENVIHEVGLFQGRLGWRRAIVLLEEGCEEFSNIVGLGQIRFPKSNIPACFEEIRRVLEREEILG
jgi:predicted nucleotide-binding protein